MDKKKLDYFKKRLETRQGELRRTVSRTEQDGRSALHPEFRRRRLLNAEFLNCLGREQRGRNSYNTGLSNR